MNAPASKNTPFEQNLILDAEDQQILTDYLDRIVSDSVGIKEIARRLEDVIQDMRGGTPTDPNEEDDNYDQLEASTILMGKIAKSLVSTGESAKKYLVADDAKKTASADKDNVATQKLNPKAEHELHMIRLSANNMDNQLYFLCNALQAVGSERIIGSLPTCAIRGLCNQLKALEYRAGEISYAACRLLGIPEDTVAAEYQ